MTQSNEVPTKENLVNEKVDAKEKVADYLIDIAFNLTDESFMSKGDYEHIVQRAKDHNVRKFISCGGSLLDCEKQVELAAKLEADFAEENSIFVTIGVHPTRCNEFQDPEADLAECSEQDGSSYSTYALTHLDKLKKMILGNPKRVVGFGEFGLDYDREKFCTRQTQQKFFRLQLRLVKALNVEFFSQCTSNVASNVSPRVLPMYLHMRGSPGEGCCEDFLRIMREELRTEQTDENSLMIKKIGGVVHSFTGTQQELDMLLEAGLDIGINGCSLKTEENCQVASLIPLDRLHLETDCPYCDIRNTHFSMKFVETQFAGTKKYKEGELYKSRNEPCRIIQVAEVMASLKKISKQQLIKAVTANTRRLFRI